MTKAEKAHLARVAAQGCVICRRMGYEDSPAEIHHQRTGIGAGKRAGHDKVIALCPEHHRGQMGIHGMGRKAWERYFGITEIELVLEVVGNDL